MAKKTTSAKKVKASANTTRRQFTRFNPDPGTVAFVYSSDHGEKLARPLLCMIVEESYAGCGLVALKSSVLKKNAQIEVKVGKLSKMKAEIRWVKAMENKFLYFGISYLD